MYMIVYMYIYIYMQDVGRHYNAVSFQYSEHAGRFSGGKLLIASCLVHPFLRHHPSAMYYMHFQLITFLPFTRDPIKIENGPSRVRTCGHGPDRLYRHRRQLYNILILLYNIVIDIIHSSYRFNVEGWRVKPFENGRKYCYSNFVKQKIALHNVLGK